MLTSVVEVYHCLLFAIILGIMHWFTTWPTTYNGSSGDTD